MRACGFTFLWAYRSRVREGTVGSILIKVPRSWSGARHEVTFYRLEAL